MSSGKMDPKTLLAELRRADGPLEELVALGVDTVLDQPVGELVDAAWIVRAVDAGLSEGVTSQVIDRYLRPAAGRERHRGAATEEKVRAWVPEDRVPEIMELMRRPFPINPDIVQDMVDQGAVRSLVGAVVQEAIIGFVQLTGKVPGLAGATSLVGGLGKKMGKGLLGGMGKGLEKGMEQRVKDFLDDSMARLTGKIVEFASSEGSLKLQGEMRADLFKKALGTRMSFYYEELAKLPAEEMWALVPAFISHNLARPELRQALENELRLGLEKEAKKTARELLTELGTLDETRALILDRANPLAHTIVETQGFEAWLKKLL